MTAVQNHELFNYEFLIDGLKEKGYHFTNFQDLKKENGQVVIRHDIDFDCQLALQMAICENSWKISSTYFFLISNDSYNILSPHNQKCINTIIELGHQVSLHYDPVIYGQDFEDGLRKEIELFETLFDVKVEIVSLHRPNDFFINYDKNICNVEHTYQSKYFKKFKYVSDSTGKWRFKHPFEQDGFGEMKSMQILIHPIWWQTEGKSNLEKLSNFFDSKVKSIKNHYSENCIPFREIYDSIYLTNTNH